jgi:hypothetical protein
VGLLAHHYSTQLCVWAREPAAAERAVCTSGAYLSSRRVLPGAEKEDGVLCADPWSLLQLSAPPPPAYFWQPAPKAVAHLGQFLSSARGNAWSILAVRRRVFALVVVPQLHSWGSVLTPAAPGILLPSSLFLSASSRGSVVQPGTCVCWGVCQCDWGDWAQLAQPPVGAFGC